jgi:peptide/nickel transport system substrate-binding protein
MRIGRRGVFGAALGAATLGKGVGAQPRERPFRFVVNVGLQVLDPIAGASFVTRNFGYVVFDTLVGMDMQGRYRPQMLEGWEASADRLTWTFRLRPRLTFHDGTPVTSEDVVASVRRWGARDSIGRRLMAATAEIATQGSDGFVIRLARPYGGVIEALGKPSNHICVVMPARIAAATPPTTPVREIVGSGPFVFLRDEWIPGERTFFRRNERYVPRDEPADGLAGGKVAKVERVEMITMPDIAMRANALQQNEVDYLEYAPIDNLPQLRRNRNIVISQASGQAEMMYAVSINFHQPPFDNVLVRRAVQQCLDRHEILAGTGFGDVGRPDCTSMFMCGTAFESSAGSDAIARPSLDRARELLREAGYRNERVVLLHPVDSALLNPFGLVLIDRMRRAGFNLDVQGSDWSSIAQRWVQRAPLDRGGWSVVPVVYTGFDMADPLANLGVGYNCTDTQPWGYCVPSMAPLIERFEAEGDPARRRALADELHRVAIEQATFPIAGQFRAPAAWRAELRGVIDFGFPVVWNIERGGR